MNQIQICLEDQLSLNEETLNIYCKTEWINESLDLDMKIN